VAVAVQVLAALALAAFLLGALVWLRRHRPVPAAQPDVPDKGEGEGLGRLETTADLARAVALLHVRGSANFQSWARHLRSELDAQEARQVSFRRLFTVGWAIMFLALVGGLYTQYRANAHLSNVVKDVKSAVRQADHADRASRRSITANCVAIERFKTGLRRKVLADYPGTVALYRRLFPKQADRLIANLRRSQFGVHPPDDDHHRPWLGDPKHPNGKGGIIETLRHRTCPR
jgi:hypothetical protein